MEGRWPDGEVDHRDGDGLNNRWGNLRESTKSQNQANAKTRSDSRTGIKGVQWRDGIGWVARIQHEKQRRHLGVFKTKEAAAAAYGRAASELFGEFARVS
jgi:hypothetical protein